MTLNSLRTRASRLALFDTAWGYGLVLILVPVVPGVILSRDVVAGGVSTLTAGILGIFVAGVVARAVTKTRTGDRLATTVVQAGLAFVLAFPATAAVLALLHQARGIVRQGSGFSSWLDLLRYLHEQWWGHYASLGLTYVVGITLCTAVWQSLPQPRPVAFQPWPVARMTRKRPREVIAGFILIVLFFITGIGNFISLTEQARGETQSQNGRWTPDASTLRTITDIGAIRSLPIAFVGLLLLTPIRWRRS
jgi:hypothetical protein